MYHLKNIKPGSIVFEFSRTITNWFVDRLRMHFIRRHTYTANNISPETVIHVDTGEHTEGWLHKCVCVLLIITLIF